jgi:hypothetical protein
LSAPKESTRVTAVRRAFLWVSFGLSVLVLVGIVLQLYFIAAWLFGAGNGALDAHKAVGGAVVHPAEVLVFLAAFGAWRRNWPAIGWSLALALVGTLQVISVGDVSNPANGWWHGLHGGLVLFVVALAVYIARREASALGLKRAAA